MTRIINIGSTAALVGWKDNPAYCASKAGLLGLTRCVALEGVALSTFLCRDDARGITAENIQITGGALW